MSHRYPTVLSKLDVRTPDGRLPAHEADFSAVYERARASHRCQRLENRGHAHLRNSSGSTSSCQACLYSELPAQRSQCRYATDAGNEVRRAATAQRARRLTSLTGREVCPTLSSSRGHPRPCSPPTWRKIFGESEGLEQAKHRFAEITARAVANRHSWIRHVRTWPRPTLACKQSNARSPSSRRASRDAT